LALNYCPQSLKCISYHRLVESFKDCYYSKGEFYPACQLNDSSRFVCLSNSGICLSTIAVSNLSPDCPNSDDDMPSIDRFRLQRAPFSYLCNSRHDGIFAFGEKMDEKYCEQWPCNTSYIRCDEKWNCLNGIDELNCPNRDCLPKEHKCQLMDDFSTVCQSIEHLSDKYINEYLLLISHQVDTAIEKFLFSFQYNETMIKIDHPYFFISLQYTLTKSMNERSHSKRFHSIKIRLHSTFNNHLITINETLFCN
jgi:hypothetical protein